MILKANTKSNNAVTVERNGSHWMNRWLQTVSHIIAVKPTRREIQKNTRKLESKKYELPFPILSEIWKSKLIKLKTKVRILNYSVMLAIL